MRDDLLGDTDRPFGAGRCAVPECPNGSAPGGLMCGPHWRQVPAPVAVWVTRTWRAWVNDEVTLGELRDAQFAAVDAVAP